MASSISMRMLERRQLYQNFHWKQTMGYVMEYEMLVHLRDTTQQEVAFEKEYNKTYTRWNKIVLFKCVTFYLVYTEPLV